MNLALKQIQIQKIPRMKKKSNTQCISVRADCGYRIRRVSHRRAQPTSEVFNIILNVDDEKLIERMRQGRKEFIEQTQRDVTPFEKRINMHLKTETYKRVKIVARRLNYGPTMFINLVFSATENTLFAYLEAEHILKVCNVGGAKPSKIDYSRILKVRNRTNLAKTRRSNREKGRKLPDKSNYTRLGLLMLSDKDVKHDLTEGNHNKEAVKKLILDNYDEKAQLLALVIDTDSHGFLYAVHATEFGYKLNSKGRPE